MKGMKIFSQGITIAPVLEALVTFVFDLGN